MKVNISLTDDKGEQYVGEAELTKLSDKKHPKKHAKQKTDNVKEDKSKPLYSIKKLYGENFFKDAKKLGEVISKLKGMGFNFKGGSVQYALDHTDFLDRSGGQGNYKWIQKYPPT